MSTKKNNCGCGSKNIRKSIDEKNKSPVCKKEAVMRQMVAEQMQSPLEMNFKIGIPQKEPCPLDNKPENSMRKFSKDVDKRKLSIELEERRKRVSRELKSIEMEIKKLNEGKL